MPAAAAAGKQAAEGRGEARRLMCPPLGLQGSSKGEAIPRAPRYYCAQGTSGEFVDLTAEPDSPRLEVVSSTVAPVALKRPRLASSKANLVQALIQQARNPPPPPPPEPKGIKCGICMEVMGGGSGRPMASGPCG